MNLKPTHLDRMLTRLLGRVIETNGGQLRRVPNHVLALTVFLCVSVLLQGIADLVLKIASNTSLLPQLPWRTDFLFLTAISVLMGYRSLSSMHHRKFDVTRNSIELGILVEFALIIGDLEFIKMHMADIHYVVPMRLPFIILTLMNIAILLYNYHALCLRKWWCSR